MRAGPAFVNFAENPHVVAVGRAQSGRTNFVRAMMRSIMARYRSDEATIVLIDPRRKSVGVVPDEWLSRYTYALGDIKQAVGSLCELLEKRLPPPTATQHEMLTRKFWEGREIFVVVDDARCGRPPTTRWRAWRPTSSRPTSSGCTSSPPPTSATGASSPRGLSVRGRVVGSLPPV
jgi:S-DNA-T family DNA segregation ATPase FtsK/SpoIIIE